MSDDRSKRREVRRKIAAAMDEFLDESAYSDGTDGICLECGEVQSGCEPDARGYVCECCGAPRVFGMEEAILMGYGNTGVL